MTSNVGKYVVFQVTDQKKWNGIFISKILGDNKPPEYIPIEAVILSSDGRHTFTYARRDEVIQINLYWMLCE